MDYFPFLRRQENIYYNPDNSLFPSFDRQLDLEQKKKLFYKHNISKIYFKYMCRYNIKYIEQNISFFKNEFGNDFEKLKEILDKKGIPMDVFYKNRIDFNTFLFLNENDLIEMGFKKGPSVLIKSIIKQYRREYEYIKARIK